MDFASVLQAIRKSASSEQKKGVFFEKLIQRWFLTAPTYASEVESVWLWEDFPARADFGGKDLGIDLVVRTKTGMYWAVQCKFYDIDTAIDKSSVDSFISNSSRTFTDPVHTIETTFSARYWIATNNYFNTNAEEIIKNQTVPFHQITSSDLEHSNVDWEALYLGNPQSREKKTPREYQEEALAKAKAHFAQNERGRLIMACGTGKTYTSLVFIEREVTHGCVLFLVPSISLLNQTLNAWMADATVPIRAICVCSDSKASSKKTELDEFSTSITELALPATTNARQIADRYFALQRDKADKEGLIVFFSTYQSIDAITEAQKIISTKNESQYVFDFIICDEAHRTCGVVDKEEQSNFTKVHDNAFVCGKKRLYMTATPRIYADNVKTRVANSDYELCSMDDETIFGKEFHCISFAKAIDLGCLTDYKVLVLTVGSEYQVPPGVREQVQDPKNKEFNFDMVSRLIGCINGLAKNTFDEDKNVIWDADPRTMRRAIAFCSNIDKRNDPLSSKNIARQLPIIAKSMFKDKDNSEHTLFLDSRHIDGSMNSKTRADLLTWLSEDFDTPGECRILCNVRCLSEGIDVPSLDAAIFLAPKNSQVDVVQSVGRIMRTFHKGRSDEKKWGYIIIPIVVNPSIPAEQALNDNKSFGVLWTILNALRSHDERFNAMINSISLNKEKPVNFWDGTTKFYYSDESETEDSTEHKTQEKIIIQQQLQFLHDIKEKIYVKMVQKVGSRLYWERWAKDIAPIANTIIARIRELVASDTEIKDGFAYFVSALRTNINPSIKDTDAIDMIGQHLITKPVFDALFAEYKFTENNSVSHSIETMIHLLEEHGMRKDLEVLDTFYDSVRMNLANIKTLYGKQTVIKNLYDNFFRGAFPSTVKQLGIVYTPVECVDFILRSVNDALKEEFGVTISDENVHVLDPFTGTGTFITRLLQLGLIKKEDLERKYRHEIHCNEIVLLAYYVADVNIECTFHEISGKEQYLNFDGISLTDTFQLFETKQKEDVIPFMGLEQLFESNIESIKAQQKASIRVIVGNPPYFAGKDQANDDVQNLNYPELDKKIAESYTARSTATLRNSLYDSYIRAFRWASDRIREPDENNEVHGGVIGFITSGGWFDSNAADGFRKCLEEDFSSIWVLHLRGNQRTSGELSKREGGKIFDSGSRAPVVITILTYNPEYKGKAKIHYADIGDYLSREKKLDIIREWQSIKNCSIEWQIIEPNEDGDWINKRSDLFSSYILIGDKKDKSKKEKYFCDFYSNGVNTGRDSWCHNFSKKNLKININKTIDFYNEQCEVVSKGGNIVYDSKKISWEEKQKKDVKNNIKYKVDDNSFVFSIYRPFCKSNLYFNNILNSRTSLMSTLFPSKVVENKIICINGTGGKKDFSCLIVDIIPDYEIVEKSQCFPLYYYEIKDKVQGSLIENKNEDKYIKHDGITDWILQTIRSRFGNAKEITKEIIFYYVYGIFHCPNYRKRFNADLKKVLPRIPIVEKIDDFFSFSDIGRKLAILHLGYENQEPYEGVVVTGEELGNFHVDKMRFAGKRGTWDKTIILYNSTIHIENIPLQAYEYIVNGRSAIEWIMEYYQIKTDKDSGIVNDPNLWAEEHNNSRYILNLLLSVITVSMKTLELVDALPELQFEE